MARSITEFGAVDKNFSSTVDRLQGRLQGFDNTVTRSSGVMGGFSLKMVAATAAIVALAAVAAAAAGVIAAFKIAMDMADKLVELKNRTGELIKNLIPLQRAFELAGLKAEDVAPALAKVNKIIGDAGNGSKSAQEKLDLLGLTFDDLKDKSPGDALKTIGEEIAKLPTHAQQAAAASKIFGESLGPQLLPFFKQFAENMDKAHDQLGEWPRIAGQYAPVLDDLKKNFGFLADKVGQFAYALAGPAAAGFKQITDMMVGFDAAAIGEKFGEALRKILYVISAFVIDAYDLLSGIWDGMAQGFVDVWIVIKHAWNSLINIVQPVFDRIAEAYNSIDWYQAGRRIGESIEYARNIFLGLLSNPTDFFGLYGAYLEATWKAAGDALLTVMQNTGNFIRNFFGTILGDGTFWQNIARVFVNAMIIGATEFALKLIDYIESVMNFWADLWNKFTSSATSDWASKLFDMLKNFARDLISAWTSPVKFIANLFKGALTEDTYDAANSFRTAYEEQTGGIADKLRSGLLAANDTARENMTQAAEEVANKYYEGLNKAFNQAEIVKSNFFESDEAMERLRIKANEVAANGQQFRDDVIKAAGSMETASKELKLVNDIATGPSGMVEATRNASVQVRESGESFSRVVKDAGTSVSTQLRDSVKGFSDGLRNVASEQTLARVAVGIETLTRKLPQAVIV